MLKIILISIVVLIAIFSIIVAMQPEEFKVTRSLAISAPSDVVFSNVNDLHKWQAWSPWAKLDPNAKTTFNEITSGLNANMSWVSDNNNVGEGSMTIIDSQPNQLIKFRLDFIRPMQATNNAEFSFKADNNMTIVTWSMYGKNNFIGKAIGLIFNCEKMVGTQFEQGLADLKLIAEKK